jgi:hypothetical protein
MDDRNLRYIGNVLEKTTDDDPQKTFVQFNQQKACSDIQT